MYVNTCMMETIIGKSRESCASMQVNYPKADILRSTAQYYVVNNILPIGVDDASYTDE